MPHKHSSSRPTSVGSPHYTSKQTPPIPDPNQTTKRERFPSGLAGCGNETFDPPFLLLLFSPACWEISNTPFPTIWEPPYNDQQVPPLQSTNFPSPQFKTSPFFLVIHELSIQSSMPAQNNYS
uniref:Uncharacterized protein n=1 Tax=Nelumbo nucifera TaxID=4432 RepID=A0A822ZUC2_NELNU|nr:TPA_asm: hypothetical protein HUJ06_016882 [Nelumbo nucifera]